MFPRCCAAGSASFPFRDVYGYTRTPVSLVLPDWANKKQTCYACGAQPIKLPVVRSDELVRISNQVPMANKTRIEWTDATWNPVRGCTKISPGCKHCYAETFAERFRGVKGHPYELGFDLRMVPSKLNEPLNWKKPRFVFVNSMSDLFHDGVPLYYIQKVAEVMVAAHWHTFQVLTKRSERMCDLLASTLKFASKHKNIWWGVSVEDRKHG